jgi:phage I-like protein
MALLVEGDAVPSEIQLLPAGKKIQGRDGRKFINDDPAKVVARFDEDAGAELPIDWEHAQHLVAPMGGQAPAAGWITALHKRKGGSIWASVEWTERGRASIQSREYRYISPTFSHDEGGRVIAFHSAGLVNRPNLRLQALNQQGAETMNKAILAALGLDESASDHDAVVAINAMRVEREAADLKASNTSADTALRAKLEAALAKCAAAELALAEEHKAQADREIAAAHADGRLDDEGAEKWRKQAGQPGGLAMLRDLLPTLPPKVARNAELLAPSVMDGKAPPKKNASLTDAELAMCRQWGVTPEAFLATKESEGL